MKNCRSDEAKASQPINLDNMCSLDPTKECDNCFRCLDTEEKDFIEIPISELIDDENSLVIRPGIKELIVSTLYGVRCKRSRKARPRKEQNF